MNDEPRPGESRAAYVQRTVREMLAAGHEWSRAHAEANAYFTYCKTHGRQRP